MTASGLRSREATILLVEDDDIDALGIERALRALHLLNSVHRVHDGVEALEALRTPAAVPTPYLILLDLNMPRMDGLEFLAELRADPVLHRSIVFVLTTSNADRDIVAAYDHHIAGYIVKDGAGDDFVDLVRMLDHYWRVVEFPTFGEPRE